MENIDVVLNALRKNNFDAYFAETPEEANGIFFSEILPALKPQTLSWGDSMTMRETKVLDEIPAKHPEISIIKTFDPAYSAEQKLYWRRQALLSDIFLTGSNAVTKSGKIVNLDMVGNRVGAITFGPKNVVLFIGVNKIVDSLEEAFARADELKVIVESEEDFAWAEENAARVRPACRLYLQPEWSVSERVMPALVEYAKAHPRWNISIQTHKYMRIP